MNVLNGLEKKEVAAHFKTREVATQFEKEVGAACLESERVSTGKSQPIQFRLKIQKLVEKLISKLADTAIFIDVAIGAIARKIFSFIPSAIRKKIENLNDEYLSYRNRLLNIQDSQEVPLCNESHSEKIRLADNDSSKNGYNKNDPAKTDLAENDSTHGDPAKRDLALQRGDVPGWVLVVLMTTGLVTALWTIAAPRLSQILRNSLDSMNGIR